MNNNLKESKACMQNSKKNDDSKPLNNIGDDKLTRRERFEKNRADRLMLEKKSLEEEIKRLKKILWEDDSDVSLVFKKEIEALKAQTLANARMELADFVNRYSSIIDTDDIKKILKEMLKSL